MNKWGFIEEINKEQQNRTGKFDKRHKSIEEVPSEIGQLTHLKDLNLSENEISSLPLEIGQLTNLAILRLAHNQLKKLPPEIGYLTRLTKLNLAGNQLTNLPPEIGQLTNLNELNLAENKLTTVSSEIGHLRNLTILRLPNNQITSLPLEICTLTNLKNIDLAGNPLEFPPWEIVRQGVSAIKDYYLTRKSWIFQAIPKRYDLREKMRQGQTETWLVTRYKDEMQHGDIVYFWQAGAPDIRGIYGWGRISGKEPKYYDNWGYGIDVIYKKVFPEHIPSERLKNKPAMSQNVLFKTAIGTNFKHDSTQNSEIVEIIKSTYESGEAPDA